MAVLECPSCNEIIEVEAPDKLHSAFSLAKPLPKSFHGKIIQKKVKCKNKGCKKTLTVYWHASLEYFCRT